MRVLILGASGLIGGNALRHFSTGLKWDCRGTYFSFPADNLHYYNTLDPADKKNFNAAEFEPEVVMHCGALTHVDYCEDHEEESFNKTVTSTVNALKLAAACGSGFIYLSTDYVFDGKQGPYREDAAMSPVSVYGRHKAAAEDLVKNSGMNYLICRVTNVYGDEIRGKNLISRLVASARAGEQKSIDFPTDQYATPVNAADVARAAGLLIKEGKSGIYNLASTDFLNRYQLARLVLKHFPENRIEARPVLTADLKQPAERPLNGGLLCAKFLAEFPDFDFGNINAYLSGLKNK